MRTVLASTIVGKLKTSGCQPFPTDSMLVSAVVSKGREDDCLDAQLAAVDELEEPLPDRQRLVRAVRNVCSNAREHHSLLCDCTRSSWEGGWQSEVGGRPASWVCGRHQDWCIVVVVSGSSAIGT
jgi:hypothetical protein